LYNKLKIYGHDTWLPRKTNNNPFLKIGGPKYTADSKKRRVHHAKFEINAGGV